MDVTSFFNHNIGDPLVSLLSSFAFLGRQTHFFKLPLLDSLIETYVCKVLDAELPVIKYTVSLFIVYPFAGILRLIPSKYDTIKHLYSCVIGILFVQWVYGSDWIHSFCSSLITYIICKLVPNKYCGIVVFFFGMGYMTLCHWYAMYTSYMSYIFDFTGTQMVLTMKLTSFAYNYYDGTYDYLNVSKKDDDRKRYSITKLPSLLQFLGYMYCFTCIMAGPAYEYNDYVQAIDGTIYINKNKKKDNKSPSTILPGLRRLVVAISALIGHVLLKAHFPLVTQRNGAMIPTLADPVWLASNPNHFIRLYKMILTLLSERYKYYFAWKVAEGSSILAGFGFQGYNDQGEVIGFAGVENVDILAFDLSWNMASMSRAWNKRTQKWLERYTYSRTGNSLYMTYFISALWHGLYPGFYCFFLTIPLVTSIERLVRDKINPILIPTYNHKNPKSYPYDFKGIMYAIFGFIGYITVMKYVAQTFALGTLENCHRALSSYYYAGHIFLVLFYILLLSIPSAKKKIN